VSTKTVQEYIKDPMKSGELKDLIERSRDQYGMQSFDQHLTDLYRQGVIKLEVARAAASNPSDFDRALSFGDGPSESARDSEVVGDLSEPSFVGDDEKLATPVLESLPDDPRTAGSDAAVEEPFTDDDVFELA
jgi:hypothetical protein